MGLKSPEQLAISDEERDQMQSLAKNVATAANMLRFLPATPDKHPEVAFQVKSALNALEYAQILLRKSGYS